MSGRKAAFRMVNGLRNTRSNTRFKSRIAYEAAKNALVGVGGLSLGNAGNYWFGNGNKRKIESKKRKAVGTSSLPHGRRVKHKPKKMRAVNSKLPKGISKKFHNKIEKSVNFTKNWGIWTTTSTLRLRQTSVNVRNLQYTDQASQKMIFASPFELLHAASVLFNQKADAPGGQLLLTGNFDDRIKLNIKSYYVNFFFKSTSSHVVNIEMFECTSKDDLLTTAQDASTFIGQSYGDYQSSYTTLAGTFGAAESDINSSPSEWLELYRQYQVKRRVFKLKPGDYTSVSVKILGERTVDLSKCQENSNLMFLVKGLTKQVFFRVLNDPTVSTTTNTNPLLGAQVGNVHYWPSNVIGGVACTFTRNLRMAALPNPNSSNTNHSMSNSIKRASWITAIGDAADQQVVYQNPITATSSGN